MVAAIITVVEISKTGGSRDITCKLLSSDNRYRGLLSNLPFR